jgi:shikimate dehydrogenase
VAAVIGDPVGHSLSPTLFNAAFSATGLDWVFVAFEVPAGAGPAAVEAARTLGLGGLSVTMPHKATVLEACDRLTSDAELLGAVNSIRNAEGELVGDNTDGPGFVKALEAETGFDPAGKRCAVVGAGGAARAVVLALARAGAREVVVVNRTPARGEGAAQLAGRVGRPGAVDDIGRADLVVNATSVGMTGKDGGVPVPLDVLRQGQVVADLIYEPSTTALLAGARQRGLVAVNGVGMLLHQAALQFEAWTGRPAPLDAMAAALHRRLGTAHRHPA